MNSKLKTAALAGGMLAFMAGSASAVTAIVSTDSNFRSGPGTSYASQFVIPGGSAIDVIDCNAGWCAAVAGNQQGYIAQSLLSFTGSRGPAIAVSPGYAAGYYDPYYYDDYYAYSYGPGFYGPSFGFGISVDRDRRHRHWRGRDHRRDWSDWNRNRSREWSRRSGARDDRSVRGRRGDGPRAQFSRNRGDRPSANFSRGGRDGGPSARSGGRGGDSSRRGNRS